MSRSVPVPPDNLHWEDLSLNDLLAVLVQPQKILWDKTQRQTTNLDIKEKHACDIISRQMHAIRGLNMTGLQVHSMWNKIYTSYRQKVDKEICSQGQRTTSKSCRDAVDFMSFTRGMVIQREPIATGTKQQMIPEKTKKMKSKRQRSSKVVPPLDKFAQVKAAKAQKLMHSCEKMGNVFHAAHQLLQTAVTENKQSNIYKLILSKFQNVKYDKRDTCFNEILDMIGVIQVSSLSELAVLAQKLDDN